LFIHSFIYIYILNKNYTNIYIYIVIEGSLEVKRPTIWEEREKSREEARRSEKKQEDQRRERVRRKKMQVREKVEKSRITLFFL